MQKLLNVEIDWDGEVEADCVQGPRCRVLEVKVAKPLKKINPGKAGGADSARRPGR